MRLFRALFFQRLWLALADGVTGYGLVAFATGEFVWRPALAAPVAGGAALALAGLLWRDVFDAHDHPRPDDDAPATAPFLLASVLTAAGWLCAMTAGYPAFLVGGALAATVVARGAGLGRVDGLGAALAGLERAFLLALGMAAHGAWPRVEADAWLAPALLGAYTLFVALVAQQERLPNPIALERLRALAPASPAADGDGEGGDAAPAEPDAPADAPGDPVRAAARESRAVEAILAWSRGAGEAPADRFLLAVSAPALLAVPPVAAWLSLPAVRPDRSGWWWLVAACFGVLEAGLLWRAAVAWLRPTVGSRRRLVDAAMRRGGLFNAGLLACAAHYALREPYPGFPMHLPDRPEMAVIAAVLLLTVFAWASARRPATRGF